MTHEYLKRATPPMVAIDTATGETVQRMRDDKCAGPNCILPTRGAALHAGGLSAGRYDPGDAFEPGNLRGDER